MNFQELLKLGREHEQEAIKRIEILNNSKCMMQQDETNFKCIHYDFLTSDGLKYEVKADFMSDKTNNCFIEFLDGRNKISGITISDANFYIIYTHQLYLMISIEKLKELTINKDIRRGKDGTKGYIINWELIKSNSIII